MSEHTTSSPSTSHAEGSRANPSAKPGSAAPKTTNGGSGLSSPESFASYDPDTCSWRTCQGSLFGGLATYSGNFPPSGTMRSGRACLRQPLVPRTSAIASSSLPTPTANEGGRQKSYGPNAKVRPSLGMMASHGLFPTPRASDGERGGRGDLLASIRGYRTQRAHWPTPTAGDAKGSGSRNLEGSKAHAGVSLTDAVNSGGSETPRSGRTGQLNPTWVEWLMGFPLGWTDLEPSETP